MKTITFNNKKYKCPTSWDEITLEQQIKVSKDTEHFKTDTTKRIALISGYLGIDVDEVRKSDVKTIAPLFKHLSFLNTPIPEEPQHEFMFKGEKYYVAQNLVMQEFQDFVSLENILHDTKDNVMEALPYILAILAKRKKDNDEFESIDDYDVEQRAELFKQLPISIANGIAVFFYASESLSMAISQLSSNQNQAIQRKADEVLSTLKPQRGQGLFTRWLIGMLRIYMKFIKRRATKYFTSIQRKSSTKKWKLTFRKSKLRKIENNLDFNN